MFFGFSVIMFLVFSAAFYVIFVPCDTLIFSFHSTISGLVSYIAFRTKYFLWGGCFFQILLLELRQCNTSDLYFV